MNTPIRVGVGAIIFVVHALRHVPQLQHGAWGEALLLFAALVVSPLLLDLLQNSADDAGVERILNGARKFQFGAALCLGLAYQFRPGFVATLSALPWAGLLLSVAFAGGRNAWKRKAHSVSGWCGDVGMMYAAVGALWLMADRWGLRPLDFDSSIVLLTAVHFHYAGWLLPVLAKCALQAQAPSRLGCAIGLGTIAGVPAVAIGITSTQLRWWHGIEVTAALFMALSGGGVAYLHLRLATQKRWAIAVRILWLVAGGSLGVGMMLAALYGVRGFFHPFPWLNIPWMRALHGSLNALGFGLFGVAGWWWAAHLPVVNKNTKFG